MTYEEILESARNYIGEHCKACIVCNGRACGNRIPGPGAKGVGDVAMLNYDAWKKVRLNMDTITENSAIDTSITLFGRKLSAPIFAGPVGAVELHYGDKLDDMAYNDILVPACREAGILAFTGDGTNAKVMESACDVIARENGDGIPTVKPWNMETIRNKMEMVKNSGALAVAMDIDAAGLPFLKNLQPPAGSKTVEELKEIRSMTDKPFILKGIMTVAGAVKAKEAGADAIVVSNHGGRVLDQCAPTAEVLPEIVEAVGDGMTVLVDGGIRSGADVFKALAVGADGVLIARPFVTMVYGAAAEGVKTYIDKITAELSDVMAMCGAHTIDEITKDMVRLP